MAAKLGADRCRYLHHDVTSEADWDAAVALAIEAFGSLDVLVNNAGILTFAPIADMPLADFRRVLEVNAVGCWLGMKAVIDPMTKAGGGSIVNISSIEGFTGAAGLSAYSASKFAIRGMTKAAAQELGQFGIRVNSVHPGGVLTRMVMDQANSGRDGARFLEACRSAGSPSPPRSPAWWRTWPRTSRPTRPARVPRRRRAAVGTGVLTMNDTLTLAGKVAIVTGAGNGLGRAESVALARAGALLVLNDLAGDAVAETAGLIAAAGGQAVVTAGDIGDVGDRRGAGARGA